MRMTLGKSGHFTLFLVSILLPGCGTDTPTAISIDPTIIFSSSFESGLLPSLLPWTSNDSARVQLVQDVPPSGGRWAIRITARPAGDPIVHLRAPLSLPTDMHRFRLSIWMKSSARNMGCAFLMWPLSDSVSLGVGICAEDSLWRQYTVEDTLPNPRPTDFWVKLEAWQGNAHFDLVKLQRLD